MNAINRTDHTAHSSKYILILSSKEKENETERAAEGLHFPK